MSNKIKHILVAVTQNQKSADRLVVTPAAVEVVMCGECRNWSERDESLGKCSYWGEDGSVTTTKNHFCAWGEQREQLTE